jgi:hypothetical protein
MPVNLNQISWQNEGSKTLPFTPLFFQTLLIILALYNIKEPVSVTYLKLPVAIGILTAMFFLQKPFHHPVFWGLWLGYFSILPFINFFSAANHHFVACYLLLAIIQYTLTSENKDHILRFHLRFILMSVLVISALHKLLSPSYTNGAFFQFEMYMDVFLKPMKVLVPGWETAIQENLAAFRQLKIQNPNTAEAMQLKEPIRYASAIAKAGSWLSIIFEAAAGIAIFFKSHNRFSHLLLLATVAGVLFFRLESGFLAIISCMALALAPSNGWKNIWLFCFVILAAMVATGAGLR